MANIFAEYTKPGVFYGYICRFFICRRIFLQCIRLWLRREFPGVAEGKDTPENQDRICPKPAIDFSPPGDRFITSTSCLNI